MGHGFQDQRSPTFSPCAAASKKAFFDRYPGASEAWSIYKHDIGKLFFSLPMQKYLTYLTPLDTYYG